MSSATAGVMLSWGSTFVFSRSVQGAGHWRGRFRGGFRLRPRVRNARPKVPAQWCGRCRRCHRWARTRRNRSDRHRPVDQSGGKRRVVPLCNGFASEQSAVRVVEAPSVYPAPVQLQLHVERRTRRGAQTGLQDVTGGSRRFASAMISTGCPPSSLDATSSQAPSLVNSLSPSSGFCTYVGCHLEGRVGLDLVTRRRRFLANLTSSARRGSSRARRCRLW